MPFATAGSEVDSWCTKCKLVLGHTVIAVSGTRIARVRCNTCMTEHAYRAGPPGTASPAKPRVTRESKQVLSFDALLAGKDTSKARAYLTRDQYKEAELIKHASFGLGLVQTVRGGKIEVLFRVGAKVLVQGLAASVGAASPPAQPE